MDGDPGLLLSDELAGTTLVDRDPRRSRGPDRGGVPACPPARDPLALAPPFFTCRPPGLLVLALGPRRLITVRWLTTSDDDCGVARRETAEAANRVSAPFRALTDCMGVDSLLSSSLHFGRREIDRPICGSW